MIIPAVDHVQVYIPKLLKLMSKIGTCGLGCPCMGSNPVSGTNENGHWVDPLHRRCPIDPKQDVSGRPAHDS